MMEAFGVSRPTVREALRVAESLGLVAVRHGDRAARGCWASRAWG